MYFDRKKIAGNCASNEAETQFVAMKIFLTKFHLYKLSDERSHKGKAKKEEVCAQKQS